MFSCIKIKDDLFFNRIAQETSVTQGSVTEPTSYVIAIDRSGSMWSTLHSLIEDVKKLVKLFPDGSYLTIGWFSSEGRYRFPIKAFRLDSDQRDNLLNLLDGFKDTVGLTCFSEIMRDALDIVEELKNFTSNHAFWMLTDGCPVVSNYTAEVQKIQTLSEKFNAAFSYSCFVGYGDYYNVDLMTQMSLKSGGILCHSENITDVVESMSQMITNSASTTQTAEVDVPLENFVQSHGIYGRCGNSFSQLSKEQVNEKTLRAKAFVNSETGIAEVSFFTYRPGNAEVIDESYAGLVKAALILANLGEIKEAEAALDKTGDIFLYNSLHNAFTVAEIGKAKEHLKDAIPLTGGGRFRSGKSDVSMAQAELDICLLDFLNELMQYPDVFIYPKHRDFEYKNLGGSRTEPGFPKFKHTAMGVPFQKLVWNDKALNLSVQAIFPGYINLPEKGRNQHSLSDRFDTQIIRNYTIIRNGQLNVNSLPLSMSKETYDRLKPTFEKIKPALPIGKGIPDWSEESDVMFFDFISYLPLMSQQFISDHRNARLAFSYQHSVCAAKAELKVFNYYLKQLEEYDIGLDNLSIEAQDYLKGLGITKHGYAPPQCNKEVVDRLPIYNFTIKPITRGFASLPKVPDIKKKIDEGKDIKGSGAWMEGAICDYFTMTDGMTKPNKIVWLKEQIRSVKSTISSKRRVIDGTRMAIVLGRTWFEEFDDRDEDTMEIANVTFKAELTDAEQKISVPVKL